MPIRLQDRDEEILRLAGRYRILTPDVIQSRFFPDQTEEAMKSTLKRLRKKDSPFMESAKLYPRGNQVYYHLSAAGAARVGVSETCARPVTDHEFLVRVLGQLLFCCGGAVVRPKFSREEFAKAFPGILVDGSKLAQRFNYNGYYLDVDDQGVRRLGRILVENGGTDLTVRGREFVRQDEEALRQFVVEGRYTLALIAASATKAAEIRRQLALRPLGDVRPVRVIVEAYEELQGLLAGGTK